MLLKMAPKRGTTNNVQALMETLNLLSNTQNSQVSQTSQKRQRTTNYTEFEITTLLQTCQKFHIIINTNSNAQSDKKTTAWQTIATEYNELCRANGFIVSFESKTCLNECL